MSQLYIVISVLAFSSICLAGPAIVSLRPVSSDFPVSTFGRPFDIPVDQVSFKPYEFGYELGDGLGMTQHRREISDGTGAVRGSYGYRDPIGVHRVVEYTADSNGYKATIKTNEPGVAGQNPADVIFVVQPPPAAAFAQGLLRKPMPVEATENV